VKNCPLPPKFRDIADSGLPHGLASNIAIFIGFADAGPAEIGLGIWEASRRAIVSASKSPLTGRTNPFKDVSAVRGAGILHSCSDYSSRPPLPDSSNPGSKRRSRELGGYLNVL
jgi:hypothetical protein